MELHSYYLRILVFIFSLCGLRSAYANCDGDFSIISKNCILEKENKLEKLKVEIKSSLANKIIYFKTNQNHYGKFIINQASSSKKECSIFLTGVTYLSNDIIRTQNTFFIEPVFESWTTKNFSLSNSSINHFSIKSYGEGKKRKCLLESTNSVAAVIRSNDKEVMFPRGYKLYYAALLLIFLSVFLVARSVFQEEEAFKAQSLLDESEDGKEKSKDPSIILRYSRPFISRYVLPIVQGMKSKNKIKERYKRKIANAGLTKILSPEEFFSFKLFLILGFPILISVFQYLLEANWPVMIIPASSLVGFIYPDLWIKGIIAQRKQAVIRQFPFIIDLLALSVEAGLDFMAGISRVIEKAPRGPLVDEFETLLKEVQIGASRAEALRSLAWRVDVVPVTSFCATLISSDQVGASIAGILKSLSEEVRDKRTAMAEEAGAKAAGKLMVPMIFLMIPAILLIIVLPFVGEFF